MTWRHEATGDRRFPHAARGARKTSGVYRKFTPRTAGALSMTPAPFELSFIDKECVSLFPTELITAAGNMFRGIIVIISTTLG